MKVVIFCGGLGTRLAEETRVIPKPMVKIGGIPIIEHIMRHYASYGHKDFILCAGYRQEAIKEYFHNFNMRKLDFTIDLSTNDVSQIGNNNIDWRVTVIDTGEFTMTGGRLKRILPLIEEDNFLLTYGDGLSNTNINATIEKHLSTHSLVTLTATLPSGRFGALQFSEDKVKKFTEKPRGDGAYINGGFFVVKKNNIEKYLTGDDCVWEDVLAQLAQDGDLGAYKHEGFWQPMDTLRDKEKLEKMVQRNETPWLDKEMAE